MYKPTTISPHVSDTRTFIDHTYTQTHTHTDTHTGRVTVTVELQTSSTLLCGSGAE